MSSSASRLPRCVGRLIAPSGTIAVRRRGARTLLSQMWNCRCSYQLAFDLDLEVVEFDHALADYSDHDLETRSTPRTTPTPCTRPNAATSPWRESPGRDRRLVFRRLRADVPADVPAYVAPRADAPVDGVGGARRTFAAADAPPDRAPDGPSATGPGADLRADAHELRADSSELRAFNDRGADGRAIRHQSGADGRALRQPRADGGADHNADGRRALAARRAYTWTDRRALWCAHAGAHRPDAAPIPIPTPTPTTTSSTRTPRPVPVPTPTPTTPTGRTPRPVPVPTPAPKATTTTFPPPPVSAPTARPVQRASPRPVPCRAEDQAPRRAAGAAAVSHTNIRRRRRPRTRSRRRACPRRGPCRSRRRLPSWPRADVALGSSALASRRTERDADDGARRTTSTGRDALAEAHDMLRGRLHLSSRTAGVVPVYDLTKGAFDMLRHLSSEDDWYASDVAGWWALCWHTNDQRLAYDFGRCRVNAPKCV